MDYDCGALVECCWQGKPMILEKVCTTVTLTTTDRSLIDVGSNKCTTTWTCYRNAVGGLWEVLSSSSLPKL